MAMAGEILGDAYVNVMAETGKLQSGLAQAQSMVEGALSNIGKTIVIGIGAALATAVGTAIASVWMWAKEEQSVKDLESSIRMLGGSVDALVPKYEKVAEQIQQNTTIADTATRTAMAQAAAMGAPVDRLDELAIAAAGLSARLGMPMRMAMMLLVRSLTSGMFSLFTRYGLSIDMTKTKTEQFNQVLEFAYKGFGKTVAMASTLSGRLTQLKNNFGDLFEAIGKKITVKLRLVEIVDEISKAMFRFVKVVSALLDRLKVKSTLPEFLTKVADKLDAIGAKFLAIAMTLPIVFNQLKKIFDWDVFKDVFKTLMVVSGKLFLNTIIDGFKALRPLFSAMGSMIGGAFEKWLLDLNLPFVRGAIIRRHETEPTYGLKVRTEAEMAELIKETKERIDNLTAGALAKAQREVPEGLREAGRDFIKRYDSASKTITDKLKEHGILLPDEIKKVFNEYLEMMKTGFANVRRLQEAGMMPEVGGKKPPWEVGGGIAAGEKIDFVGFADWWKKMQKESAENKEAKTQTELQKQIAENTKTIADKDFGGSPIWSGAPA